MDRTALLAWLVKRSVRRLGIPAHEIPAPAALALEELQESRDVWVRPSPEGDLVWLDPRHWTPWVIKRKTLVMAETDLPPDVPKLKHMPDRDSQPTGGRRSGQPIYRSTWPEPSSLFAVGSQAWPPAGCAVRPRRYLEPRAQFSEIEIRDMDVVALDLALAPPVPPKPASEPLEIDGIRVPDPGPDPKPKPVMIEVQDLRCPVCRREIGITSRHQNCLVCDSYPAQDRAIRLEPMPAPVKKIRPARKPKVPRPRPKPAPEPEAVQAP